MCINLIQKVKSRHSIIGAVVRSLFKVSEMFCIRIEDVE